jgi:ribosomal protein L11 methyltransferase
MFSLELECEPEERDLLVAELWEQGSAGIVEIDERRLRAFFEDGLDVRPFDRYRPVRRVEESRDYVAEARERLQPMEVGARFYLAPEWRDDPAPPGRFRIVVNPGLAFGTGVHETTRLCLEALERSVRPGMAVLDVGTGSGILAEAAGLLGAAPVYACDIDPIAVEVARARVPRIFVGSASAVRPGAADLLVANISPEAVTGLSAELRRCLRPGGIALLSGFETAEVPRVRAAFPGEVHRMGDWALLEYFLDRDDGDVLRP